MQQLQTLQPLTLLEKSTCWLPKKSVLITADGLQISSGENALYQRYLLVSSDGSIDVDITIQHSMTD